LPPAATLPVPTPAGELTSAIGIPPRDEVDAALKNPLTTARRRPDRPVDRRVRPTAADQPAAPGRHPRRAGNPGWTRGGESIDLTLTTPTPIHYNAECTRDAQRLDAGELRVAGTFDGAAGHVWVQWSACGQDPDLRFVAD